MKAILLCIVVCLRVISECVDYHVRLNSLASSCQKKNERKKKHAGWRPGECGTVAESMVVLPVRQMAGSHV